MAQPPPLRINLNEQNMAALQNMAKQLEIYNMNQMVIMDRQKEYMQQQYMHQQYMQQYYQQQYIQPSYDDIPPLTLSPNNNVNVNGPPLVLTLNNVPVTTPSQEQNTALNLYKPSYDEDLNFFRNEVYEDMNLQPSHKHLCDIMLFGETTVSSRDINRVIAEYLLDEKNICSDICYQLYHWDKKEALFHIVNEPADIEYQIIILLNSVDYFYKNIIALQNLWSVQHPEVYGSEIRDKIYKTLSTNYKKICRCTDDISKSRCESICRHIIRLLKTSDYKDNVIEYLAEGGRPLFIPFKDNTVIYIGPDDEGLEQGSFYERIQYHAFTDKCLTLLSMKFIHEEVLSHGALLKIYLEENEDKTIIYDSMFLKLIDDLANGDEFVKKQLFYFFGTINSGFTGKYFWHLYTPWQNAGKTALFNLIKYLLGEYAGFHPFSLVTGKADAIHQSAMGSTMGERATIMDETGENEDFKYNEEVVKKYTGGADEELSGRFAGATKGKNFLFKTTTQLIKASNRRDTVPVPRLVVIEFKSGFTEDINEEIHHDSWYRDQVTKEELLDGLNKPGAIKLADPFFSKRIKNNRKESLKFLCICIYYAIFRFKHKEEYNKVLKASSDPKNHLPSTIFEFMNCEVYCSEADRLNTDARDDLNGLAARQNPYIYPVDATTPVSKWVTVAAYYRTYCAYVLRNKPGVKPVSHSKFVLQLQIVSLLSDAQDRVKFLAKPPALHPELRELLEANFEPLQDTYHKKYFINEGLPRSAVHEAIINKVREINTKREAEGKEKFHVPNAQNILSWITEFKRDWIKGSGKSGNLKYYHVKQKI